MHKVCAWRRIEARKKESLALSNESAGADPRLVAAHLFPWSESRLAHGGGDHNEHVHRERQRLPPNPPIANAPAEHTRAYTGARRRRISLTTPKTHRLSCLFVTSRKRLASSLCRRRELQG